MTNKLLAALDRYFESHTEAQAVAQVSVTELPRKVDIYAVSGFGEALDKFETNDFRHLAIKGLEAAPLQFWIMPAAMSTRVHHSTEHGIGEVVFNAASGLNEVRQIGGKAFHTLRVLTVAEIMMDADDPAVRDWGGRVKKMRYGNEMTPREKDLIRVACLWHDVFSGGTEDAFNAKRRGMDKEHPRYHRSEWATLKGMVKPEEWELLLKVVESHMWKWDDGLTELPSFHNVFKSAGSLDEAHKLANEYRIIRTMELADLIASKNF